MAPGSDSIENVSFDSLTLKPTGTLISPSLQSPPPLLKKKKKKPPPPPPPTTLSFDCIAEILSRLPQNLLFQLRYKCKFFNSLFSIPNFGKQQLRYSSIKCHHLMVSFLNYKGRLLLIDSPIASDFSTSTLSPTYIRYPKCLKIGYWASSSCDGILCLTMCKGSSAILWNPTLRTFKRLPPFDNKPSLSAYSVGYDCFINNYKVVGMSFFKDRCEVSVLTLGMDSWRKIQDFPYSGVFFGLGVFVGGTVNWLPIDNVSSLHVIVSLDLKKESYRKILHPNLENDDWSLGELKDCLCIYASSGNNMFLDVWIMKEYGNKGSWTKLYCVPHMGNWGICDYTKTLYISDNDQLLMSFYERGQLELKLVVYDSKNGTFMIPEIQQNLNRRMAIKVYIESMVSPCF